LTTWTVVPRRTTAQTKLTGPAFHLALTPVVELAVKVERDVLTRRDGGSPALAMARWVRVASLLEVASLLGVASLLEAVASSAKSASLAKVARLVKVVSLVKAVSFLEAASSLKAATLARAVSLASSARVARLVKVEVAFLGVPSLMTMIKMTTRLKSSSWFKIV